MRQVPSATIAALGWYALVPLLGMIVGEAAFFPWPHLFMMLLGLDSTAGLVVAILIGGIAIAAAGLLLRRFAVFRSTGLAGVAIWGLLLAIGALLALLMGAWAFAALAGWPTAA